MRVTTASTYLQTARGLATAMERASEVKEQLSSGKTITKWSDDAPGATAAERYRAGEADWSSFGRAANDARGLLATTDGTLQSMSTLLTRARELAITGMNGGLSAESRNAAAEELKQIRKELRDLGNTTHLGRPLFAGFGDRALSVPGDTDDEDSFVTEFIGDAGEVERRVSPTVKLTVNLDGNKLFGFDTGSDVFATLKQLEDGVRSNDRPGMEAGQRHLAVNHASVLKGLSTIGTTTNRVQAAQAAGAVAVEDLAARRSALEDVDLAEAVLQLNAAQAGYQAALGAAARANLPSLADFLK